MREREQTVGVVSVDPSSPFSHGALLGDRIRLSDHFLDPGVFIRSMGTRGHLGGLAEATLQAVLLLDAAGKDVVFVETVGAGQSEVEVTGIADTVLLVLMPGSGDSVQALKAGIMEIPDVIAINKMDHPAAKTMLNEVRSIVALAEPERAARDPAHRGARRGERAGALGRARGAPRGARERRSARGASAKEPRGRGVRRGVESCEARTCEPRWPAIRGCSASWRRVEARELDPLSAVRRDHGGGVRARWRRRSLTSRPRASGSPAIARVTPLYPTETFSRLTGRQVYLKAENLQRTGSFKIRGAYNTHRDARRRGARAPASSPRAPATTARRSRGRHARPASRRRSSCRRTRRWRRSRRRGRTAAPPSSTGESFEEAVAAAQAHVERTGATLVHAFEDERVIAGQGTIGLELAEQAPDAETVLIPIGGGGLAAGIALALKERRPDVRVDRRASASRRLHDRRRHRRQASGRAASSILERLARRHRQVSDEEISEAIVLCLERTKLLVEGAGAVGLAALLAGRVSGTGSVAVVLSGGNIDATTLISVHAARADAVGPLPRRPARSIPDRPGRAPKRARPDRARSAATSSRVDHHREGAAAIRALLAETDELELRVSTRGTRSTRLRSVARRRSATAGITVERVGRHRDVRASACSRPSA